MECLKGVLEQSRTATGSDRAEHEEWYQNHRRTFLKLFPDGEAALTAMGLPETTKPLAR